MAEQECNRCGKLMEDGDLVKAIIVSRYVGLKSKAIYALEKPTECHELRHVNCQFPRGEGESDSNEETTV